MMNKQLITLEEAAQYCETTAKIISQWDNADDHLRNKVAVCLEFAGHLRKHKFDGANDTWDTLVEDCTDSRPDYFKCLDKCDLHLLSCYLTPLNEEVANGHYESWIDDVSDEQWLLADKMIANRLK